MDYYDKVYKKSPYIKERERRILVIKDSFLVSTIVCFIGILCAILSDSITTPILISVGGDVNDVLSNQNTSIISKYWEFFILGYFLCVIACVGMLEYLKHGEI